MLRWLLCQARGSQRKRTRSSYLMQKWRGIRTEIGSMCDMSLGMTDGYCWAKTLGLAGSHQHSIARAATTHSPLKEFFHKLTGQGLRVWVLFCLSEGSHCLLWGKRFLNSQGWKFEVQGKKVLNGEHMETGQPLSLLTQKFLSILRNKALWNTAAGWGRNIFGLKTHDIECWTQICSGQVAVFQW